MSNYKIYYEEVDKMNVTLILYESKYGTGKIVADTICPVLGPAKSFDINDAPHDIKYYSNIVLVFSMYGHHSCKKILKYIDDNKIDFSKKRVALVCIGLNKQDGINEINKIKTIINKECIFSEFIKGEMFINKLSSEDKEKIKAFCSKVGIPFGDLGKLDDSKVLELGKNLIEYFNTPQFIPPANVTKKEIETFLINKNTCTLATGYGDFVRATPLEYEYYNENLYIISEGGLKFIGLLKNNQVSICIYEDYKNMNNLCGLQISGEAEILQPWCEEYLEVFTRKELKIENISKLPFNMNIIKIVPTKYEFLCSKFKNLGFDSKQIYIPKK
ncbi:MULTISPECIES: flavodoxin domain-containing protein [Terrisporobacter]|nr:MULTISPECIES: flavodoxin domain-containing protein [Terrisporobacter]MCC3671187.1 pyridoxamine 5'-phosphate oxidase family protein [Terrisporobacter mayombei]MDU6984055.1 flavodoxin domain-containing protein [Terrisporobacter othiniensis]MDY3373813.1 flavodoxin domain-containing protein [Terrisporobacter othiniensis]